MNERGDREGGPGFVRSPVMFQEWCAISFLHWRDEPAALQTHLPAGLEIDTFDGSAWVGLTPFHLRGLRLPFMPPVPWLSQFPEMNLRTYVRGPAGPGIWFFSLDAASLLAVLGARLTYGLPYHWARMQVQIAGAQVDYRSTGRRSRARIAVQVGEPLPTPDAATVFLTERYRLYTRHRRRLAFANVEHLPWPLCTATLVHLEETVRRAAGLPGHDSPALVHYSPGVHVRVGRRQRVYTEPGNAARTGEHGSGSPPR